MICRQSRGCYIMGCRNDPCRLANNAWKREYKARKKLAKDVYPAQDCGICSAPISAHHPYWNHLRVVG